MKRFLFSCVAASFIALPALAALKAGDAAPDFSAQASLAGNSFNYSLKSALKQGPVVVYFYPSSFTGGCNIQAHTFAVNSDKFTAAGATPPMLAAIEPFGVTMNVVRSANPWSISTPRVSFMPDCAARIARS